MTKYEIINAAVNMSNQPQPEKSVLVVIHNSGFFSNCTIALMDIIGFVNKHGKLPDEVDRTVQFMLVKSSAAQNLIPHYFNESDESIDVSNMPKMQYDCMSIQFAPYSKLPFSDWLPIVNKYFTPSNHVGSILHTLTNEYKIDYANTVGVFFRGNDKNREMKVAPYSAFIDKAREVLARRPNVVFLVQPDETEYKKDSAIFYELPQSKRAEHGAVFFAALLAQSRCSEVITHSGNLGLWTALYRGNSNGIHQIFNGQWLD
jgi:hypothetical protein